MVVDYDSDARLTSTPLFSSAGIWTSCAASLGGFSHKNEDLTGTPAKFVKYVSISVDSAGFILH
jgi:hypothetical protein